MTDTSARKRVRPASPSAAEAPPRILNHDLAIEYVAVRDLKLPDRRLRQHTDKQIAQIAGSIRTFGFNDPIIIGDDDQVVAGVGRALAALELKLDRVPALRLAHMNADELRAYAIAENRLAEKSSWDKALLGLELGELSVMDIDFDLELTGFDTAEIDILIADIANDDESDGDDEVEQLGDAKPVSRRGDLWQLGDHLLLCGDARDADDYARLMSSDRARMVFTDPPYNVKIAGNVSGLGKIKHDEFAMASGEMSVSEFTTFLSESFERMVAVSVDGAIHFACIDWRHLGEMLAAGHQHYSELKNVVVWNKKNGGMGQFYRSKHELVFVWKVGKAEHVNTFGLGGSGRYRTNVWDYDGITSAGRDRLDQLAMHPTVKPVAMVADAIKDCSHRGDIVLDPFGGSGTTIIAAERSGRIARLIEFDPKYVDAAIHRYLRLFGGKVVLAGTGEEFIDLAMSRAGERSAA